MDSGDELANRAQVICRSVRMPLLHAATGSIAQDESEVTEKAWLCIRP
jgi:hypothetical protein